MQASDMIWVGRRSIVVALMLTCACPGNRRGPTRECGVAQEVCNGDVCSCQDDSTCTVQARPHCASDTASVCCNNQCTFVLAPAPAQCECIVGEVRACGNGGTQTCLDQNPGSLSAETDKSIWDPRCHEPVPPPPVETWYRDDDGDGFCGRQQASVSTPGAGWSTSCPIEPAACEGIAAVHVPSVEVPGDGIDNDCVGGDAPPPPPPPATRYFQDPDADGYCGTAQDFTSDPGPPWLATCARREPAACENDPTRNPRKHDVCGNGKDEDCWGGDAICECPPQAPMKCECTPGGFVSECVSVRICQRVCDNQAPSESCSCRRQ
jgi:hypothetical protein